MTKDSVHRVGHFSVCQILLHMAVRAVITSSPPAWTSSARMSTPADFPFLNNCTAASTFLRRMGWPSSVSVWRQFSTNELGVKCQLLFLPSLCLYLHVFLSLCFCMSLCLCLYLRVCLPVPLLFPSISKQFFNIHFAIVRTVNHNTESTEKFIVVAVSCYTQPDPQKEEAPKCQ